MDSLAELTKNKSRRGRQYGQPVGTDIVSSACKKGRCGQCWMLKCNCSCHNRKLPPEKINVIGSLGSSKGC